MLCIHRDRHICIRMHVHLYTHGHTQRKLKPNCRWIHSLLPLGLSLSTHLCAYTEAGRSEVRSSCAGSVLHRGSQAICLLPFPSSEAAHLLQSPRGQLWLWETLRLLLTANTSLTSLVPWKIQGNFLFWGLLTRNVNFTCSLIFFCMKYHGFPGTGNYISIETSLWNSDLSIILIAMKRSI